MWKKVKNVYRVQQEGCPYLFNHLPASSLIAEGMQSREYPDTDSTPADREGQKIDLVSLQACSSSALNPTPVMEQSWGDTSYSCERRWWPTLSFFWRINRLFLNYPRQRPCPCQNSKLMQAGIPPIPHQSC